MSDEAEFFRQANVELRADRDRWQEEARRYCDNADYWRAERDRLAARLAEAEKAITEIDMAVVVVGPNPVWHAQIMARHRAEWPTLWEAIDAARAFLGENTDQ